ncbi:MAG: AbrB/MazE/SpoVT family DNA-binding domain-containing protein [Nitrososphaerales archaeon]
MELSKVAKKGLTNIPAKVRKAMSIEEGDILAWSINKDSKTIIVRIIKNSYRF